MRLSVVGLAFLTVLLPAGRAGEPLAFLKNGGFEVAHAPGDWANTDVGFGIWQVQGARLVPADWTLNTAYPGTLAVRRDNDADEGRTHLYIAAAGERAAHIS